MNSPVKRRLHAVIPAAGQSRRMGQPKLLLQLGEATLIEWLIKALRESRLDSITVLTRPKDHALQRLLGELGVDVLIPEIPPAEMRVSVELLLDHLMEKKAPATTDGWLLIPADHPIVEQSVLSRLINAWLSSPEEMAVPCYQGRRGHPAIFPWLAAKLISEIPVGQGINWLVRSGNFKVNEVACVESSVLLDVDTPEDFEQVRQLFQNR